MELSVDHREHDEMQHLIRAKLRELAPSANQIVDVERWSKPSASFDVAKMKLCQLPIGDYADFEHGFAVERKSDDFLPEVHSGALFQKLNEISRFPHAYLVIDQTFKDLYINYRRQSKGSEKALWNVMAGAVASCMMRGFPPVFCEDKGMAAEFIVRAFYKANDEKNRKVVPTTRPHATHKDRATNVLLGFPHIGTTTATKLLDHFGSVDKTIVGVKKLYKEPNKELMRQLGLDKRKLEQFIAVLIVEE